MDFHGELYKFSEQEIENLIGTNQEVLSNDDISNFLEAYDHMPFQTPIQDELLPCAGMNTNSPNQDFNMFDLNEISEEIINLNIPSTPEIINQKKNCQKSKINGLGQFGGAEDDEYRIIRETSRKNLKFNCSETVLDLQVKEKEYANFT